MVRLALATVTAQVAVMELSAVLATVIVAEPAPTAVTAPFETVATLVSLDSHVSVLSSASSGVTVATSVAVSPGFRFRLFWFRVIPVTSTASAAGIIAQTIATTRRAQTILLILFFIVMYLSSLLCLKCFFTQFAHAKCIIIP